MNLRWLLFDYADPDLPLTMRQRMKVACRAVHVWQLPRSLRAGRWLFAVGMSLPMFFVPVALLVAPTVIRDLGLLAIPLSALWMVVTWPWCCILYGLFCRREHYHRLRLAGLDVCLKCGYWLRGLPDDERRCPECGAERTPMPR